MVQHRVGLDVHLAGLGLGKTIYAVGIIYRECNSADLSIPAANHLPCRVADLKMHVIGSRDMRMHMHVASDDLHGGGHGCLADKKKIMITGKTPPDFHTYVDH